jgi:hypothetical protein
MSNVLNEFLFGVRVQAALPRSPPPLDDAQDIAIVRLTETAKGRRNT